MPPSQTPNLKVTEVEANQNQKEVTINTGFVEFDGAITDLLSVAMPDADYTLSTGEGGQALGHMAFQFTGTITADRDIIVPTGNKKLYLVMNATSGSLGYTLTVKTASGTGVAIPADDTQYTFVYCDGTNVVRASLAAGAGTGTVTNTDGSLADGEVVLGNGSADVRTLGDKGTNGQVLTSQGPGVDPNWQTPSGGAGSSIPTGQHVAFVVHNTSSGLVDVGAPFTAQGSVWTSSTSPTSSHARSIEYKESSTDHSSAGGYGTNANYRVGKNIQVLFNGYITDVSDTIAWFAMTDNHDPVTFGGTGNPASSNYAGFRFSTADGDTNWMCCTSNGSSQTVADSGVAADTNQHRFGILFDDSGASVKFYIDGALVATITTNRPTAGTVTTYFIGAAYVSAPSVRSGIVSVNLGCDF